jgi:hypothetical protein
MSVVGNSTMNLQKFNHALQLPENLPETTEEASTIFR